MISTKERYEENVGYDRNRERRFTYNENNDRGYDNHRQNSYSRSERATNDDIYRNTYENVNANNRVYAEYSNNITRPVSSYDNDDRYVNNYSSYNTDQRSQFAPMDMSEVMSDVDVARPEKLKKSKTVSKISIKSKLCIAIYFALVALIVAMLLINAIPSVGAQVTASPDVVVNNESYDSAMDSVLNSGSVVVVPPYNYDTTTNWFDDFCDYMGGLFS